MSIVSGVAPYGPIPDGKKPGFSAHLFDAADMSMKEDAVSRVHPNWGAVTKTRYKADPKALAFLMYL